MTEEAQEQLHILNSIISSLSPLTEEQRVKIIQTVCTFLEIPIAVKINNPTRSALSENDMSIPEQMKFSDHTPISPKDFLIQKMPRTDVERICCLGYYLTHYRDMPYFKTIEISKLNTEAAQPKLSNTAYAVRNATQLGYLAPAPKGQKQLSAAGEQFVQALPEREAAKAILSRMRPRKKRKSAQRRKGIEGSEETVTGM